MVAMVVLQEVEEGGPEGVCEVGGQSGGQSCVVLVQTGHQGQLFHQPASLLITMINMIINNDDDDDGDHDEKEDDTVDDDDDEM